MAKCLSNQYPALSFNQIYNNRVGIAFLQDGTFAIYDPRIRTVEAARNYFSVHPLTIWYKSVDYYKSTGPFYTVVELSDDPYRAVGFELTQPLFDGDSLKVGGKSGFDQMVVLDGSEDEAWVVSPKSGNGPNAYYAQFSFPSGYPALPFDANTEGNHTASSHIPDAATGNYVVQGNTGICCFSAGGNTKLNLSFWRMPSNVSELKSYLQSHPLTVFYRSTEYTEENDIPVAIEKHTGNYLIFDGTEPTVEGISEPFLAIQDVASNHNSSHRIVSNVAPFVYEYGGVGAFVDYYDVVFGRAWCQSNGFFNTETVVKDFKSFLTAQYSAGAPVQVVYELVTPASYARPAPTMIAQPGEDGTFIVTGENSLSVLLKPFQDGGDAATIEGHTWADILAAIQAATASTANALLEEKTNV